MFSEQYHQRDADTTSKNRLNLAPFPPDPLADNTTFSCRVNAINPAELYGGYFRTDAGFGNPPRLLWRDVGFDVRSPRIITNLCRVSATADLASRFFAIRPRMTGCIIAVLAALLLATVARAQEVERLPSDEGSVITVEVGAPDEGASGQAAGANGHQEVSTQVADWSSALGLWREFIQKFLAHSLYAPDERKLVKEVLRDGVIEMGVRYRGKAIRVPDDQDVSDSHWLELEFSKLAEVGGLQPLEFVEELIAAYCRTLDLYTRYVSSEEVSRLATLQAFGNAGVGMQIEMDDSSGGGLFCYPFPGGPADKAGVQQGARLLSVDGKSMRQATLGQAAMALVGIPSTKVLVEFEQPGGRVDLIEISRAIFSVGSVMAVPSPLGRQVRLRNFRKGSARDLRSLIEGAEAGERLTIDLRGNPGGDLGEAVLAASLFLDEGAVVCSVETRNGTETLRGAKADIPQPSVISILLDGRTASSAELFAVALRHHLPDKVKLYGETTLGKGVTLDQVYLEAGGRLTVTSGRLLGPAGESWDKSGVKPD